MKFYLAGRIDGVEGNHYIEWRQEITKFLAEYGHEVIDPCIKYKGGVGDARELLEGWRKKGRYDIVRDIMNIIILPKDKKAVLESDGVIAYVDKYSVGTIREITIAHENGKPVLVIYTNREYFPSNTLIGMSTKLFKDFQDLKTYLKSFFTVYAATLF